MTDRPTSPDPPREPVRCGYCGVVGHYRHCSCGRSVPLGRTACPLCDGDDPPEPGTLAFSERVFGDPAKPR